MVETQTIVIISLIVITLAVGLYLLLKKSDKPKPKPDWIGAVKQFEFPDTIANCLIIDLAAQYSFDYFTANKKDCLKNVTTTCFGTKGNWNKDFYNSTLSMITQIFLLSTTVATCVVNQLQSTYSPKEFIMDGRNCIDTVLKTTTCLGIK